eukprot:CAMPEP_0119054758 /NCGR_PEP_ID=MMETSP1177-20130426/75290_1 /TAXON_ID=2985 /ORGANISM="Ochromonas sp, Strain CCMP1899" /LENGTH=55 /DNA_ID=CAMNT_0007035117 /DNA_START=1174 /DNA_END=1341 /DNA_ORIENTATION=+
MKDMNIQSGLSGGNIEEESLEHSILEDGGEDEDIVDGDLKYCTLQEGGGDQGEEK